MGLKSSLQQVGGITRKAGADAGRQHGSLHLPEQGGGNQRPGQRNGGFWRAELHPGSAPCASPPWGHLSVLDAWSSSLLCPEACRGTGTIPPRTGMDFAEF